MPIHREQIDRRESNIDWVDFITVQSDRNDITIPTIPYKPVTLKALWKYINKNMSIEID